MDDPTAKTDENNAAAAAQDGKQPILVNLTETKPEEIRPNHNETQTRKAFHPIKLITAWWRSPSRRWNKPKGERAKWTDKAIVMLTAGIVFLAFMQWLEMHEGGKQTDRIIAADERMAVAMEGAVGQAKTSFEAANKQAILSQRAWVSFGIRIQNPNPKDNTPPEEPLKVGTVVDVRTTIKNTGRTPAINVKGILQRIAVNRAKGGTYPYPTLTAALQPHENLNHDGELYGDMLLPFTENDKRWIDSGKVRVYFYGRIEYDDVFGGHHWRNTCAYLLPTGAFAVCQDRNGIDYNPN
jgi:hypothetical protein